MTDKNSAAQAPSARDSGEPLMAVLGRVPSGLFIVTARSGQQATGMLVSWVMQAGFEPPAITVAVKKERYVADWLTDRIPFAVNVVGESEKSLVKHFAAGFEPGEEAFAGRGLEPQLDVPVLSEAMGYLRCEPTDHFDSGDHRIFLARVTGGRILHSHRPWVHVRNSGQRY